MRGANLSISCVDNAHKIHLSMIICYFNIICVAMNKSKTDPPLVTHRNGELSFPFSFQLMKPVGERNLQVLQTRCEVKIFKPSHRPLPDCRRQPLRLPCFVQFFRVPVGKRFYHCSIVNCNVTLVNKIFPQPRFLSGASIWYPSIHDLMTGHIRKLTEKSSQGIKIKSGLTDRFRIC